MIPSCLNTVSYRVWISVHFTEMESYKRWVSGLQWKLAHKGGTSMGQIKSLYHLWNSICTPTILTNEIICFSAAYITFLKHCYRLHINIYTQWRWDKKAVLLFWCPINLFKWQEKGHQQEASRQSLWVFSSLLTENGQLSLQQDFFHVLRVCITNILYPLSVYFRI